MFTTTSIYIISYLQLQKRTFSYYVITQGPIFGSSLPSCLHLFNFGSPLPLPLKRGDNTPFRTMTKYLIISHLSLLKKTSFALSFHMLLGNSNFPIKPIRTCYRTTLTSYRQYQSIYKFSKKKKKKTIRGGKATT